MYNNYPSDGSKKICTVTAVDLTRAVCKCISDLGEILVDVRWLVPTGGSDGSNSSYHPVEKSKVLVDISSGFPFILGAILNESANTVRRPNVGRQDIDEPQIADYTTISTGDLIRGPGTPRDQRVGDILNTSDGGAIQGVLSGGTVINKASPLAQVVCSRFGDLVRVVSRNYDHFSDVESEQKVSIRGNLYDKREVYRDPELSRSELPNFVSYTGNVQAAELISAVEAEGYEDDDGVKHKYTYASIPLDSFPAIPGDDLILSKGYVYDNTVPAEGMPRIPTSTWSRDINGAELKKVQSVDELNHVVTARDNLSTSIQYTTEDSESTFTQDATSFHVDVTDSVSIDGDATGVVIHTGNADDSTLTEIRIGADGTLTISTTADASMSVGGNFVANVTGTTDWTSGGNITFTAPIINLNN